MVMKGTTTAGVGELANFLIGCAFVMPAAWIYKAQKTKKNAVIGMAVGTVFMAAVGGMVRRCAAPGAGCSMWENPTMKK